MGGLRDGETVLVHSAGGGVGIAAVQLALHVGARVIGTASRGKHEFLKELGVEHCIDYRTEDFERRVKEISGGAGVELVLDAVGGASFKKSFRCLAPTGRLGMFGISSAATGKQRSWAAYFKMAATMPWLQFTPPALMNQNKGVFGVNLGRLSGEIDRLAGRLDTLLDLYRQGAVKPVVAKVFSFEHAALAHHFIQDRKNIGKVVLVPRKNTLSKMLLARVGFRSVVVSIANRNYDSAMNFKPFNANQPVRITSPPCRIGARRDERTSWDVRGRRSDFDSKCRFGVALGSCFFFAAHYQ